MSILPWRNKTVPIVLEKPVQSEKRDLQKELAHTVVDFDYRYHAVKKIADQALKSMREGQEI